MHENEVSEKIIGAAIEVHKFYGPGLVEQVYEEALCHELNLRGVKFKRQKQVPIFTRACNWACRCGWIWLSKDW